jgi:hypothetical protein
MELLAAHNRDDRCANANYICHNLKSYLTSLSLHAFAGSVPPLPAVATQFISYHDPGGASTMTQLEALTLEMINNHESSDKLLGVEAWDQQFARARKLAAGERRL